MLSTQSTLSTNQMPTPENPPRSARLNPQTPSFVPQSPGLRPPNTGGVDGTFGDWLDGFQQHQGILEAMAQASLEPKFQEELGTIEGWFKVLNEAERTATLYALMQHSSQAQIRFFIAVLQQMVRAAEAPNSALGDGQQTNNNPRSIRPPSLNLPMPRTPFSAGPMSAGAGPNSAAFGLPSGKPKPKLGEISEEGDVPPPLPSSGLGLGLSESDWASMVNTPLGNMFPKRVPQSAGLGPKSSGIDPSLSGFPGGFNMNMMGVSQEAQLLAMQLVMSGMVQPGVPMPQGVPGQGNNNKGNQRNKTSNSTTSNWRGGTQQNGAQRFPRSALKSPAVATKSPGSGGNSKASTGSATVKSAASTSSPGSGSRPDDDVDPELLKDVAAWLKSLRLHKYTPSFEDMTWEQMVLLDDCSPRKERRLLRTFYHVRQKFGIPHPPGTEIIEPAKVDTSKANEASA
ncbi:hypothetical protein DL96DRAFT_1601946 [Flagelloscypha sp. PMI_526]|nr:hypothetical protein DL96DRAFT_1601946 [Flagelloscypha sp. PMI_526]